MKNIAKILTGLSILTVTPIFSMVACTPEDKVAFDVETKTVDQANDNSVTFVLVAKEKIECEIIEPVLFCGEQKIAGEVTTKEPQKWTIKFAFEEKIEESSACEIQFSFKGKKGIETTKISGLTINPYNPLHATWDFKEHDYISKVAQSTITTMSDAEATDTYFKQLKEEPYTYIDDMFMSVAEVISFPGADVTVNEFTYEINVSNINFDQKTISFYQNMQLDAHIKYGEEFEGDIITKGWAEFIELPLSVEWWGETNGENDSWGVVSPIDNSDITLTDWMKIMNAYKNWKCKADLFYSMTGERGHTYQFEYSQGKETEPQTDADVQEIASALKHFDSIQSYHLANVKHSTGE